MDVDWPRDFDRQLDRLEADESPRGVRVLALVTFMLTRLRDLTSEPNHETSVFARVRQHGRYPVWRVSHPFEPGLAVRLICWFPPRSPSIVVALFVGEKSAIAGVFYDTVGARADQIIQRWKAETRRP